jgi:hypothetical protein
MEKVFLSNGEHMDDVMTRIYNGIDKVLASEITKLTQAEKIRIFKDISIVFKDAE